MSGEQSCAVGECMCMCVCVPVRVSVHVCVCVCEPGGLVWPVGHIAAKQRAWGDEIMQGMSVMGEAGACVLVSLGFDQWA